MKRVEEIILELAELLIIKGVFRKNYAERIQSLLEELERLLPLALDIPETNISP